MAWNVWNTTESRWENLTSFKTRTEAIEFRDEVVLHEEHARGPGPFEVKRTGAVLEEHGTQLMQLKPSMVWSTAMKDLERRQHNIAVGQNSKGPYAKPARYQQYAFHRAHVMKAATANDILRAAIDSPGIGKASGKKDTRLLYADVELLKASLQ